VNWHTLRTHHYTIDAYHIVATACLRTVHYRGPAAKWLNLINDVSLAILQAS